MSDHDVETLLRDSLRHHAGQVPPEGPVVARVLARVEARSPRRHWRPWALPLAAAAVVILTCVALVVAHQWAAIPPAVPISPPVTSSTSTAGTATTTGTWAPTAVAPPPVTGTAIVEGPVGPQIRDVSFTSPDDGWLLASATCATGTGGCLTLLHSADGGAHWTAVGPAPAQFEGYDCSLMPCIDHLRFANSQIGYAFGTDALYLTTDGGQNWVLQAGKGADALQIAGDTVILARLVNTACPDRCPLLLTSPVGSTDWKPVDLSVSPQGAGTVQFAGDGQQVALLANPVELAHGAGRENASSLYLSSDGGRHWTAKGEQCPDAGAGYTNHSFNVALSSDGAVTVYCLALARADGNYARATTITSTDGGETFTAPAPGEALGKAEAFAAASASDLLVSASGTETSSSRVYRSTDGGASWSPVTAISVPVASIEFLSPQFGWMLSEDGHTLWTTHDGQRWVVSDTVPEAPTADTPRLLAIHMVTATAGWALADAGLLYTDDGGATWAVRSPPKPDSPNPPVLTGLDFEGNTAFSGPAEMWFAISGSQVVTVFHTTDAGRSWSSGSIPAIPAPGGSGGMISAAGLSFPTSQDGWLLANVNSFGSVLNSEQVAVYRTRDGGETWTLVDAAMRGKDSPSGLTEHGLKTGIGFATPERGWITGYVGGDTTPWMYQTADGGSTWTRVSLPAPEEVVADQSTVTDPPQFVDDEHGVFPLSWPTTDGGSTTIFQVTDDSGATWQSAAPLTWIGGPWLAAWPDSAHAVVVNGLDWCTTATSDASWQCRRLPDELEGVTELSFVTAQLGWAVAEDDLYRTTDSGGTWSLIMAGPTQ